MVEDYCGLLLLNYNSLILGGIKMKLIDIYYVEQKGLNGMATCSTLDFIKSWDGSIYCETNMIPWAGQNRRIELKNQTLFVGTEMVQGFPSSIDIVSIKCPKCTHEISVRKWLTDRCVMCEIADAEEHDWEDSV